MNSRRSLLKAVSGVAMIEVLVAILVFSVGIIGLMSLQAASLRTVSDSKMRMDASNVVQKLVAEMWSAPRLSDGRFDYGYLRAAFETGKPAYTRWYNNDVKFAASNANGLPRADETANAPTVTVPSGASGDVVITVFWQAPSDATRRQYVLRTSFY